MLLISTQPNRHSQTNTVVKSAYVIQTFVFDSLILFVHDLNIVYEISNGNYTQIFITVFLTSDLSVETVSIVLTMEVFMIKRKLD